MELIHALFVALGINIAMFIPAYLFKTDTLTDISYAATFFLLAVVALMSEPSALQVLLFVMAALWAARLGTYLLVRIRAMKRDKRFDDIRRSPWKFMGFWLFQGFTAWVVLLPVLLGNNGSISLFTVFGFLVFGAGLAIESVADYQKYQFKKRHPKQWISSGIWAYSRHPNYFGEIVVWVGVYLAAMPALSASGKLIGLLGPAFITFILLFVSGIPMLEKRAKAKWGKDKAFREYQEKTSLLIPLPRRC